jgi:hypothetical protein
MPDRGKAALGRFAQRRQRLLSSAAIGVFGQSNEQGAVLTTDTTAQAFVSQRNPSVRVPFGPSVSLKGGMWPTVYDALDPWGWNLKIVNGAIGSLGFIRDVAGMITGRSNSTGYYQRRPPNTLNDGDKGDRGDIINVSNRMFRCTSGRTRQAINLGPNRDLSGSYKNLDFLVFQGTQATAASSPDFSTAVNVGDTVVDGTIVWTLEATFAYGSGAPPTVGQADFTTHDGVLFDPLSAAQRLHLEMQKVRDVERKIIYMANGQADLYAGTQTWYRDALIGVAKFFLQNNYEVMIGLTSFSPGSGTTAQYDGLVTQRAAALATLQANPAYGSRVYEGANLYALMGSTGPMAAGGAFLQNESGSYVHLNGAGAVVAGGHIANALKAVLPQQPV